jgi:hypothetical protein
LNQKPIDPSASAVVGCDVARFGDDNTEIMARRGDSVILLEHHNGWSTSQTAGRLKEICRELASLPEPPMKIQVRIDDAGVGGGVVDQADGYNFIGVNGASKAISQDYPNIRSEAWFAVAQMAREGRTDLSRLSAKDQTELRRQCMSPMWKLDNQGRRVVEPKSDTKKRLGRSPDGADALNLCYASLSTAIKILKW